MELFSFIRKPPRRCARWIPINGVSVASASRQLWFFALALPLFATTLACSREDTTGSSSVPTSLSANTALTDLGQRAGQNGTNEIALSAKSESSPFNRQSSATGIASLYADTDGDAALDFVEVCDQNTLCIEHPSKSSSKTIRIRSSRMRWSSPARVRLSTACVCAT